MSAASVAPAGNPVDPVVPTAAGRNDQRFRFQCGGCGANQTRHVRTGHYVTCKSCGASNPGPAMTRTLHQMATAPPPAPLPRGRPPKVSPPSKPEPESPPDSVGDEAPVPGGELGEPAAAAAPKPRRGLLRVLWEGAGDSDL